MNSVQLIGRLTRDPEVRYTQDQMAIATFSIAIDRPPRRDGTRETDFPRITVFGRQAENCEKYLVKGRLVGIEGRIQTGSYTNRNGDKVYTTDVVAFPVRIILVTKAAMVIRTVSGTRTVMAEMTSADSITMLIRALTTGRMNRHKKISQKTIRCRWVLHL